MSKREPSLSLAGGRLPRVVALATLHLAFAVVAPVARAQPWTPCEASSADATTARLAINRFVDQVRGARPGADPVGLQAAYDALFDQPCLVMAGEVARPELDTVLSMRGWLGGGGSEWLYGFLHPDNALHVPPSALPELTLESADADDPLRGLLCSAADPRCGRATAGWRLRAVSALRRHSELPSAIAAERSPLDSCVGFARESRPSQRYQTWSLCAQSTVREHGALPLGRFRAPTTGWFVISGVRGHYNFCEEIRAYDLSSGAAYVVRDCHEVLNGGDSRMDMVGRVPVDALREAAWMAVFAPRVVWLRPATAIPVPEGMRRQVRDELVPSRRFGRTLWGSSGQSRLDWVWVEGGAVRVSGTLRWPDSSAPGVAYADELLRIAEAALEPGCAPVALPPRLVLRRPPEDRPAPRPLPAALVSRLRGLDRGACPAAPRPTAACRRSGRRSQPRPR